MVTKHYTSSYHPNTNGTVERQNSTLAASLRTCCNNDQKNWPALIPSIMMAFRNAPSNNTTKFSPFYMVFGQEMRLLFDIALEPKDSLPPDSRHFIQECLTYLKMAHEIGLKNETEQKAKDKELHDLKAKIPELSIGDQV